ncbi:MAG: hypothetical protein COA69_03360 [Robiginitomaculum sp.]|nr:MAG: hypothetical protein COA69_03360 [Robiginitomaculum sp.]
MLINLRKIPSKFHWLVWLAPLIPLIWVTDLTGLFWLGFTVLALIFVEASRKPTFALVHRSYLVSIGIGLVAGLVLALIGNGLLEPWVERLTGSKIDLSQFANIEGNLGKYFGLLVLGLVFGGIVEEVFFRGYFIGWGSKIFGEKWSLPLVVLISFVFGYGHLYQGISGFIVSVFCSIVFGLVYVFSGRKLLPVIMTHMTYNFIGITQIYLYGVG